MSAAVGCKSNISINESNIMGLYSDRLTLDWKRETKTREITGV